MKVNGLVYRINDIIYLSLLDKNYDCTDGIPINEGCYDTLNDNQISYVDVNITDGTLDFDMNVFEFAEISMDYNPGDIFYHIKDILTFTFDHVSVQDICDEGQFEYVAKDIAKQMEIEKIKNN